MAENTKIEWADDTVGFWWGCMEHGPECANCYAREGYPVAVAEAQMALRLWASNRKSGDPPAVRMEIESAHGLMRKLNRKAEKEGRERIVFVNSQADTFEDSDAMIVRRLSPKVAAEKGCKFEIAYEFEGGISWHSPNARIGGLRYWNLDDERREMFRTIDECPMLRCLLLTKRPENIRRMWPLDPFGPDRELEESHRPNVWLGTSAGTQETADKAIPELLQCRDLSPVLFVSAEPLLGPVDFTRISQTISPGGVVCGSVLGNSDGLTFSPRGASGRGIDWVIVGGESGPGARPMLPQWARDIRDQCAAAGIAFHFKQWGEFAPVDGREMDHQKPGVYVEPDGKYRPAQIALPSPDAQLMRHIGKKAAGRLLDGVEHNEFPQVEAVHA